MGRLLIAFSFLSFLISCDKNREYAYIEVVKDEGILGDITIKDEVGEMLQADNDSTAYLEAYKRFCLSLRRSRDLLGANGKVYKTPLRFKLITKNDEDITYSVVLADKDKSENDIMDRVFSPDTSPKR